MSALPAIISRLPPGLLSALGLQNTGAYPRSLANGVQPTIEMRDWYFAASYELLTASTTAGVNGAVAYASLEVPAGEWWWVHSCLAVTSSTTATGKASHYWILDSTSPTGQAQYLIGQSTAIANGFDVVETREFFLPPGAQPTTWVSNIGGAGNLSLQINCQITRLRI